MRIPAQRMADELFLACKNPSDKPPYLCDECLPCRARKTIEELINDAPGTPMYIVKERMARYTRALYYMANRHEVPTDIECRDLAIATLNPSKFPHHWINQTRGKYG